VCLVSFSRASQMDLAQMDVIIASYVLVLCSLTVNGLKIVYNLRPTKVPYFL